MYANEYEFFLNVDWENIGYLLQLTGGKDLCLHPPTTPHPSLVLACEIDIVGLF
jgi:hypothetical protein